MENISIGKFQILKTLGQGAHSSILQIRRSEDSKQYALKVVPINDKEDLKYLEQAQHEFHVAQMLQHPNLIKIYSLEEIKSFFRVRKVHLLIEFVNGETLDQVRGLTIPRLVQVFEKIANGMVHMHRRKVYHADLKPNNVMLSKSGKVKIIDYGLAWIKGEPKGRVQGTPEYMAPEQVKNQMVNARTDIYNLGATMYRMVTWQHPPSIINPADGISMDSKTFQSLLKPVAELNPKAPPELCDLIHRCLSFKSHGRPERMSEVQGALDHLVDDLVKSPDDRLDTMEW